MFYINSHCTNVSYPGYRCYLIPFFLHFFLLLLGKNLNITDLYLYWPMGEEIVDSEDNVSKMFSGTNGLATPDAELAMHIIHRFNICRDTLETMPAFEEHLEPLFQKQKEK